MRLRLTQKAAQREPSFSTGVEQNDSSPATETPAISSSFSVSDATVPVQTQARAPTEAESHQAGSPGPSDAQRPIVRPFDRYKCRVPSCNVNQSKPQEVSRHFNTKKTNAHPGIPWDRKNVIGYYIEASQPAMASDSSISSVANGAANFEAISAANQTIEDRAAATSTIAVYQPSTVMAELVQRDLALATTTAESVNQERRDRTLSHPLHVAEMQMDWQSIPSPDPSFTHAVNASTRGSFLGTFAVPSSSLYGSKKRPLETSGEATKSSVDTILDISAQPASKKRRLLSGVRPSSAVFASTPRSQTASGVVQLGDNAESLRRSSRSTKGVRGSSEGLVEIPIVSEPESHMQGVPRKYNCYVAGCKITVSGRRDFRRNVQELSRHFKKDHKDRTWSLTDACIHNIALDYQDTTDAMDGLPIEQKKPIGKEPPSAKSGTARAAPTVPTCTMTPKDVQIPKQTDRSRVVRSSNNSVALAGHQEALSRDSRARELQSTGSANLARVSDAAKHAEPEPSAPRNVNSPLARYSMSELDEQMKLTNTLNAELIHTKRAIAQLDVTLIEKNRRISRFKDHTQALVEALDEARFDALKEFADQIEAMDRRIQELNAEAAQQAKIIVHIQKVRDAKDALIAELEEPGRLFSRVLGLEEMGDEKDAKIARLEALAESQAAKIHRLEGDASSCSASS